jgi:hypothetical protein
MNALIEAIKCPHCQERSVLPVEDKFECENCESVFTEEELFKKICEFFYR